MSRPSPGGEKPAAPPARRRRLLIRLVALVLPAVVVLGGLELGLRLAGYGRATGFLVPAAGKSASGRVLLRENGDFGRRYFPRAIARRPIPVLLERKAVGEPPLRVCVLGGSAAMGDPAPAEGMGRMLEVLMQASRPDREVEVVCAAMTAINSHVLLPIARDCVDSGADVLVVYVGNNEVVGPYGAGTVLGSFSGNRTLIALSQWARGTRIGQLIEGLAGGDDAGAPATWAGMEMFLGQEVPADDPRLEAVVSSYRANLGAIVDLARSRGVKVVLAEVATNLADCPPFASQHRRDLTAAELASWEAAWERGKAADAAGEDAAAMAAYREALPLDDRYAELRYRIGRLHLLAGDSDAARVELTAARDLDTLRFRADTALETAVTEVFLHRSVAATVAGKASAGIGYVNCQQIAADESPRGIPGLEVLHEHVHLNRHGNYLVACALLSAVEEVLGGAAPAAAPLTEEQVAGRLGLTPWDELETLRELRRRMANPPYTNQAWSKQRLEELDVRIAVLARTAETTMGQAEAIATYDRAIAGRPRDWRLYEAKSWLLQARGDFTRAAETMQEVIELVPHYAEAHHTRAVNLYQASRKDEALAEFARAIELNPDDALARHNYGQCLLAEKRADEAVTQLEEAVRLKPDLKAAWTQLGFARSTLGQMEQAMEAFGQAIEIDPDDLRARANLAAAQEKLGRTAEAAATLDEAIRRARELGEEEAARQLEERRRQLGQ